MQLNEKIEGDCTIGKKSKTNKNWNKFKMAIPFLIKNQNKLTIFFSWEKKEKLQLQGKMKYI